MSGMDSLKLLGSWVPDDLTPQQRRLEAARIREAGGEARQQRAEEAQREATAERYERQAIAARQLGLEPGALTAAAQKYGDAQTEVQDARERLQKAEKKAEMARSSLDYVNELMSQAAAAAGPPVYAGELPASRHAREIAAELQREGRRR